MYVVHWLYLIIVSLKAKYLVSHGLSAAIFVSMHDETDITFKCVDAECFHQHVKHYYGMPITDNDLVFYHNNVLAKFLEPIPNYLNPIANS